MTDPASFRVDIALSQLNMVTGRFERMQMLATGELNDGEADVTLPSRSRERITATNNTRPIAFEVVVSSLGELETPLVSSAVVGAVRRWSPVVFFTSIFTSAALRGACEFWRAQQQAGIGGEILSRLPPCPRRLDQARAANSGFKEDTGLARFLSRNFFHRGSGSCFRQTTFSR